MNVENAVVPTCQQMKMLSDEGQGGPIHMVNLLKFKAKAEYEDGREAEMTGEEAYALYHQGLAAHVAGVGGEIVIKGKVTDLQLGQIEELWDSIMIVRYPDRKATFTMIMTSGYQESAQHRAAGLAGQLNIEMVVPGV